MQDDIDRPAPDSLCPLIHNQVGRFLLYFCFPQAFSRLGFTLHPTWLRVFALKSAGKLSGLSVGMFVRIVEAMWSMRSGQFDKHRY